MSILVRQIARAADGREIVRPIRIEAREIIVGRLAECDIHLADLGVEPRHAVIRPDGGGRIEVEAIGGIGFLVDGRKAMRAAIDAATGAELRFGSHRLTVGLEAGEVAITVERVGALSEASELTDRRDAFTLRGLLPGKRVSAWSFALLVLAAFLAWPIYSYATYKQVKQRPAGFHADQSWSSGKLSRAHAGLEGDCQACHREPFVAVKDQSCVACHANAHDHAEPARLALARGAPDGVAKIGAGFARAFNKPAGRCVDCHSEHEGAGPMAPTAQRFCTDCHGDLNARLKDTRIENAGDFATAHPQFRPAVMVTPDERRRVSLDLKPGEDNGVKFSHALHLSKSNAVARMAGTIRDRGFGASLACKDCHTPDPSGARFLPVNMERDCAACHSLAFETIGRTVRTLRHGDPKQVVADLRAFYRSTGPMRPINLGGLARRVPGDVARQATGGTYHAAVSARARRGDAAIRSVFSRGGACFDCHSVTERAPLEFVVRPVVQPMRYLAKGWFDHDAHKTEPCATCHKAAASASARDLLLPGIKTCRTCHGGETSHADVPSGCALCHDYHAGDGAPWVVRRDTARTNRRALR